MGLVSPTRTVPYTYLINTMKGNTTQNINEHLPITLWENQPILCVFVLIIFLVSFTRTKIKLRDLFTLGGVMLLTLMSKRQESILIVIGLLIFNKYFSEFINNIKIKTLLENIERAINTIIGGGLVVAIVGLIGFNLYKDIKDDVYISEKSYPVQASEYILNNMDIENMRIFNEYNYGSYMLFKGIPVFIDSRADLYAPEFNGRKDIFSDFLNISNRGDDYETKFEEYGITHVILYKDARLNYIIKEKKNEYKELYNDKYFVIYERK